MKRRLTIVATLLVALAVPLASAQTLRAGLAAQPDTLDPHATSATSSFQAMKSIYDTLIEVDRSGELVPGLAESWTISDDGLTITFNLVEGVKFHNGEELTSADVKATFERILDPDTASPKEIEYRNISSIDTPDDHTVVFSLSTVTPALLSAIASGWGAILPATLIEAGHDFANDPVGSGPFEFDRWVRDSTLELVRFDDYFRGPASIDGVHITFVSDSAIQLQGLTSGQFDVIDQPAAADIPLIEADPQLSTSVSPSGLVLVAAMNSRREPFGDVRVRQAMNLAVNKEIIMDVAYGGGFLTGTFMEAGSPWLPADLEPWPYDPERAQELLAEAGYPDGFSFTMTLPQLYDAHILAGQIIQSQLAEIGVNAEIEIVEWGVWLNEVYSNDYDFDMTVVGHTGKLDPTGRVGGYADDDNYVGFSTPELAELITTAAVTPDQDVRRELYGDVLWIMHEQAPWVFLGTPNARTTTRANIEGFWITPLLDSFNFYDVVIH